MDKRKITEMMPLIEKLVDDLYWEYDRMSSSGKESLDKLAGILDIKGEQN